MNLFSVMLRKKLRPEDTDIDAEEGEEKKSKAKSKKEKDFVSWDFHNIFFSFGLQRSNCICLSAAAWSFRRRID